MFLRDWDIGKLMIFHPKSIKENGCNVAQHLLTPKHRKYQKLLKFDSSWDPKSLRKSSKINSGSYEGLPECILDPFGQQNP